MPHDTDIRPPDVAAISHVRWLASTVRAVLRGRSDACAVVDPLPLCPAAAIVYGAGAAGVEWAAEAATGHHLPYLGWIAAATCVATLIVMHIYTRLRHPDYHGHCATCGRCSIHAGVPAARTFHASNESLTRAGWQVTTTHRGGPDHCPIHRQG